MATNGSFLGFLHKSGLSALPNFAAIQAVALDAVPHQAL